MYSARTAGARQIRDATMIAEVAAREAVFADKPIQNRKSIRQLADGFFVLAKCVTLKSFFGVLSIYETSI